MIRSLLPLPSPTVDCIDSLGGPTMANLFTRGRGTDASTARQEDRVTHTCERCFTCLPARPDWNRVRSKDPLQQQRDSSEGHQNIHQIETMAGLTTKTAPEESLHARSACRHECSLPRARRGISSDSCRRVRANSEARKNEQQGDQEDRCFCKSEEARQTAAECSVHEPSTRSVSLLRAFLRPDPC